MSFKSLFLLLSRAKQLIEQRTLEKEESENKVSPIAKTHGVALHFVNYG